MDAARHERAAMRSPINWALLGLLIGEGSYGYELLQRFKDAYAGTLTISSPSQIYTALDTLERRGLITSRRETIVSDPARQRRLSYTVTAAGVRAYEGWLLEQMSDSPQHSRLLGEHVASLGPRAHSVLDRCAEVCLELADELPQEQTAGADGLAERLAGEERRLRAGAILAWIEYARSELAGLEGQEP